MAISAGSRYASSTVTAVTGRDGLARQTIMPKRRGSTKLTVQDYVWQEGDRVDLVAGRAFGDETMWWVFAQANPEILDWMSVEPGTVIRIPNGVS